MKKKYAVLFILLSFCAAFVSCSSNLDNSITLKNLAAGDIHVNFRGSEIVVPSGETKTIKNIVPGTYTYSTTYEVPAAAKTSSVTGGLSGSLVIKPGTKILILYSSSFQDDTYVIGATVSNSDDQGTSTTVTGT
jgi:hypothetical protein